MLQTAHCTKIADGSTVSITATGSGGYSSESKATVLISVAIALPDTVTSMTVETIALTLTFSSVIEEVIGALLNQDNITVVTEAANNFTATDTTNIVSAITPPTISDKVPTNTVTDRFVLDNYCSRCDTQRKH